MQIDKKQKLMFAVLIILLLAYGWRYREMISFSSSKISNLESKLLLKEAELQAAMRIDRENREKMNALNEMVTHFYSAKDSSMATLSARQQLDGFFRSINLKAPSINRPNSNAVSPYLEQMTISFNYRLSMQDLSKFFMQVEQAKPHFFFQDFNLKADNPKNPQFYDLRCNLEVYSLTKKASRLVEVSK